MNRTPIIADARALELLERIAVAVEGRSHGLDALLTARQLAALLQIDARTLRQLRHEGAVPPPIMVGGRSPRWKRATIEEWLARTQQ